MKKVLKSISICFIIVAMLTAVAFAAAPVEPMQPQASKYISGTTTAARAMGSGQVRFTFDITATKPMKDVGALQVDIYEVGSNKNTCVETHYYTWSGDEHLMGHNKGSHMSSVTYDGVAGRQYYANVMFFAGEHGVAGDVHSMGTAVVKAV